MKGLDITIAVALGGAVGAVGRYGLTVALRQATAAGQVASFPLGTFTANLAGSFLLGVVVVLTVEVWRPTRLIRPFAGTGILGGFTTFSTFSVETRDLVATGHGWLAAGYALSSVVAVLAAVRTGTILTRRLARVDPKERP